MVDNLIKIEKSSAGGIDTGEIYRNNVTYPAVFLTRVNFRSGLNSLVFLNGAYSMPVVISDDEAGTQVVPDYKTLYETNRRERMVLGMDAFTYDRDALDSPFVERLNLGFGVNDTLLNMYKRGLCIGYVFPPEEGNQMVVPILPPDLLLDVKKRQGVTSLFKKDGVDGLRNDYADLLALGLICDYDWIGAELQRVGLTQAIAEATPKTSLRDAHRWAKHGILQRVKSGEINVRDPMTSHELSNLRSGIVDAIVYHSVK